MDHIANFIQTFRFQESMKDVSQDTTRTVVHADLILHLVAATISSIALDHSCLHYRQTNYYWVHLDRDFVTAKVI
jgi:hypothetical protein